MQPLDLHGVKHELVSQLVDNHIWEAQTKKLMSVQIITGNSDTMKSIVRECLKDYGMEGKEEYFNSGTLTVDL